MTDRDPTSGKFLPGNKANPGGRPKGLSISALIDKAVTENDWRDIIGMLLTKAKRGDLKAIEMLTDRRFGKSSQPITGEDGSALEILVRYADRTNPTEAA